MQEELRQKILDGVADGNKINWSDFVNSLDRKEYAILNNTYSAMRMEGLVHREVDTSVKPTQVFIVAGDFRKKRNQPVGGE